ncbi:M96 mating-specific protein family [Phytophthora infestans T30-4]|uniref:M96 mating-specific protein family n=1 Tax=Phytophthora infestans (strain T30-4) TaxID=403677 RepID=D0NTI1_PHYIT|nr:M96 mating-specific protein family [Phytophthora infestans T30-4]EEY64932.1 M96 mating-specific protein family [Phytophthora infestans T30-4]|eukprot:XP_002897662.1 M96 mating-specific protein family [Phytophthora infestans T30-4]
MEQRQIEEEEELMQEALALLADCQDDDYDAAISRLLLPSDDELHSPVSANRSDPIMSTTELAHAPMPVPLNLGLPPSNATFSAEVSPSATPTLTTATSSPVKKTPMSTAKQQQRKKKAPSSTGKKRKTASHNSNRARDERKEELIYLRKTVQTMEARLRTLQLSQRRALAAPALASARIAPRGEAQTFTEGAFALAALQGHAIVSEPPRSPEDMKEDAAMGPVWTEIAARQYQERRRVELENIRLKLILEGQIKMAKSLEKMLTKRTSLRVMESIQGKYLTSLQHRKPTSTEEEDEAAIFARLEKELETALDEVDVVFEAIGLARMEKTYADAQVRRENGTTIMEIFANKVVPFSVEATSHAVWEHFVHSMDHIPSRFVYQKQLKKTETTDDTLMESFGLELVGSRNATAAFRVRQIRRKFVQPHRVVIAWPMYSEALELSAEPTKGTLFHTRLAQVTK